MSTKIKTFTGSGTFDVRSEMLKDTSDMLDNVEITDIAQQCVLLKKKEDEVAELEDKLKAKNTAFQKTKNKKSGYTKQDFIRDYPKSQTAKKYYQSDKGYRDYKKSLKKEDIEQLDAYDMVLEYLFATEQVTTLEEANYIMMEMDQQTVGEIVTEVKQELHELLPLAGLALGGLAVNALRKRGKAKRMGKAAGKAAAMGAAGTAAGKGGSMVASVPKKKPGDAAGKVAKSIGGAAGKLGAAMGAAGGKKRLVHGIGPGKALIHYAPTKKRAAEVAGSKAGKAASRMGTGKKSGVDLTGKTKAQIMALKRLGKI